MNWQVTTRIGANDEFRLALAEGSTRMAVALERPGDPWSVGNNLHLFRDERLFPAPPIEDLLNFAVSVYAADLTIPRRLAEDQWEREITVHLPVVDVASWRAAVPVGVEALRFLTGDSWNFELRERKPTSRAGKRTTKYDDVEAVSLFSGGLDSLVGAIDLLAEGRKVALVGHHGSGVTMSVQEDVLAVLRVSVPIIHLRARPT